MDAPDYGKEFKENLEREIRQRALEGVKRPKVMVLGDFRWGLVWGAIIVLIGIALLFEHLGVNGFDRIYRFWPTILVLFGIMNIVTDANRGFGILLTGAGVVLQLNELGYLHLTFAELWPLAIIAVGLLVMWGSLETRGFLQSKAKAVRDFQEKLAGVPGGPQTVTAVAVFGGCERRISVRNFLGGKATAIFGGIQLDFHDADIETEAVLEINCIFGGVELRIPENWTVHSRNLPLFGGYEDKTRQPATPDPSRQKTLIVTGMVIFGGIEIKN